MTERTITIPLELFERMALLMDASLDALDAAAALEKRRESGKSMRQVTEQERAKTVRTVLAWAVKLMPPGFALDALMEPHE